MIIKKLLQRSMTLFYYILILNNYCSLLLLSSPLFIFPSLYSKIFYHQILFFLLNLQLNVRFNILSLLSMYFMPKPRNSLSISFFVFSILFLNETPMVHGLAADKNNKMLHRNYDLLME